jgi:GNAT superfamily N-acetyltransferase
VDSKHLHFVSLTNTEILPYLDSLGNLRLRIFHEYPYLYEGTVEDEREYLSTYVKAPSSLIVLAIAGKEIVGATTCVSMIESDASFRSCFEKASLPTENICYLGESVLLPEYRGRGIGKIFFQKRLEHAWQLRSTTAAFCSVERPINHPLRPAVYRPLDGFWESLGFQKHPELQAQFVWREVGEATESPKTLTFWLKCLD